MPKKKIQKFVAEEEQDVESDLKNPNHDGKDEENELGAKLNLKQTKRKELCLQIQKRRDQR